MLRSRAAYTFEPLSVRFMLVYTLTLQRHQLMAVCY